MIVANPREDVSHFPRDHPRVQEMRVIMARTRNGFIAMPVFEHNLVSKINAHRAALGKADKRFLLMLDGHASHFSLRALEHNIALLFFPAHTGHRIQPPDRGFFHSFKTTLVSKHMNSVMAAGRLSQTASSVPATTRRRRASPTSRSPSR